MQPYLFPYLGYFQLINAVDVFIFYDDVNFINRGWINRNRIVINNKANYFTVQLSNASQNKLIKNIEFLDNRKKILKTIELAYKKAPFFDRVFPIIEECLNYETNKISELAIFSIIKICEYMGMKREFVKSSEKFFQTKGLAKEERLIEICKLSGADTYINAIGGMQLYSKETFYEHGIKLLFLKSKPFEYKQLTKEFIPNLSIIDVLMFNNNFDFMLNNYELI